MSVIIPTTGQLNWDVPLDAALTSLDAESSTAQSQVTNHISNLPADPHGDRAYTDSKVNPIFSGVNQPNGFVQLTNQGVIPSNLITGTGGAGGMFTNVYDAVALGMKAGTSDSSVTLQGILNSAATAGGGIVYIGPGTYSWNSSVAIGNNTWLLLSEGTTINRITGSVNPSYMITNVAFNTNGIPATNVLISGGKLDAVGPQNLASNCTPIFIVQSSKTAVFNMQINNVFNNPAIEINGCGYTRIRDVRFTGTGSNTFQASSPAIRLNITQANTTPNGLANTLYNNSACFNAIIDSCEVGASTGKTFGPWGSLAGTDTNVLGGFLNQRILISNCTTANSSLNGDPISGTNFWGAWSAVNNLFADTDGGWFNMSLSSGFTTGNDNNGNPYPPQYKILSDGNLAIRGSLSCSGNSGPTGVVFATLPVAFANMSANPPTGTVVQANGNHSGTVYITGTGALRLSGNFIVNDTIYIDTTLRIY